MAALFWRLFPGTRSQTPRSMAARNQTDPSCSCYGLVSSTAQAGLGAATVAGSRRPVIAHCVPVSATFGFLGDKEVEH